MVYSMAWQCMALYMVWPGGHGIWHGLARYTVWHCGHGIVYG